MLSSPELMESQGNKGGQILVTVETLITLLHVQRRTSPQVVSMSSLPTSAVVPIGQPWCTALPDSHTDVTDELRHCLGSVFWWDLASATRKGSLPSAPSSPRNSPAFPKVKLSLLCSSPDKTIPNRIQNTIQNNDSPAFLSLILSFVVHHEVLDNQMAKLQTQRPQKKLSTFLSSLGRQ